MLTLIGGWLSHCNLSDETVKQDFKYVPLKEYEYENEIIQPGTELQLIAFSGGKPNDKENIYYYQFIAVNLSTGDTLRILTPLISVDESSGVDHLTYSTPLQFDPERGITTAYYAVQDSSQNLLLQTDKLIIEGNVDTSVNIQSLVNDINANEWVVINKSLSMFENQTYKTTIGILNFKKIPW